MQPCAWCVGVYRRCSIDAGSHRMFCPASCPPKASLCPCFNTGLLGDRRGPVHLFGHFHHFLPFPTGINPGSIRLFSFARRAPSERRSAPALSSPSRSLPPLSPTCFFTHLTSSLPGRARARAGVLTRPGLAGAAREARPGSSSPRASLCPPRSPPPQHLYPGPTGFSRSAPPHLAPARQTFRILSSS